MANFKGEPENYTESYKECAGRGTCQHGCITGTTYYRCCYGACSGYKCQKCGQWVYSNVGEPCSLFSDEDITEAVKEEVR